MTLFAYAAIYLIWGSTFLAIRLAIDSIPPLMMMGLRCTAAGGLLLAWAALQGERAGWRAWAHGAVAGSLMFGCAYGALAWAEERLASGVAALLVATLPFWLTVFDYGRRRTAPAPRMLAGLVIGLGGVALLVWRGVATVDYSGGSYPPVAAMVPAYSAFDVVEIAASTGREISQTAEVYFDTADRLQITRLRDQIVALPRDDRWNTLARGALRDDLYSAHAALAADVLTVTGPATPEQRLAEWVNRNEPAVQRAAQTLTEIWETDRFTVATLSVAVRAIRTLVAASTLPAHQ